MRAKVLDGGNRKENAHMKIIAGKSVMTMKECVEFIGLSRSTIAKNIALTKKKKMTPPFPFIALFCGEKRQKYFFDKEAIINWVDARSFG